MNEKETGSFYTPQKLIEYMINYVSSRVDPKSILEPSAGDGRFANHLKKFNAPISLIEFDKSKTESLQETYGKYCNIVCDDFIKYSLCHNEKYDLIIGNPPYIAKKNIPENQFSESEKIIEYFKIDKSVLQNLWVAFVLSSLKMLSDTGTIFFVLPFEFLQVQYAEKLRAFLETKFNTIEIITFEERIFEDIEQDVCLVYLANERQDKPYIKYSTLISAENPQITFESVIMRNKPLKKWSNCILNDEETEALINLSKRFTKINDVGEISPGIVTGANSFFILPKDEIDKLKVPNEYILPVITKSTTIPSLLVFGQTDFENIISKKNRTHLLNLSKLKDADFSQELKNYIKSGEDKKTNEGYKCKKRKRWYDVPIVKNGDACFFKRYHYLPRVIANTDKIHSTDIIYNIRFNTAYEAQSFAFCFYNSLTLALCEYNGRFYGGGVGELVPSEFKQLAIPYKTIAQKHIDHLDSLLRQNSQINDIIDYVDDIVLDQLTDKEKSLLQNIRMRYIERRMKNNKEKDHER